MKLAADWRRVLRYAWSVRLMAVAFILTVAEALLPFADGVLPIPRGVFALLSALTVGAAFVARLVAQQSVSGVQNADQ
jgi:hypothetical protein